MTVRPLTSGGWVLAGGRWAPEGGTHDVLSGCVYLCLPFKKNSKVLLPPHFISEKTEAQRG